MTTSINPALEGPVVLGYLKFAIPSIVALLALSAAPIVDGLFIANYLGIKALAAVNLIIPVVTIGFGLTYMIAIGGAVSAGKFIGEGNKQAVSDIFSKTVIVGLIYSLVFVSAGIFFSENLFALLGAEESLFPLMHDYFNTILWFLPFEFIGVIYYYFIRISGFPTLTSVAIVIGVFANIGLNYLLIAILDYGLIGAALATGVSGIVMLAIMMMYIFSDKAWLQFKLFQSNWWEVARSAYNGLSDLIDETSAGVVTFILNIIVIGSLGSDGVAAFSVVSYSLYVGVLFFFGLSEALQAVCSQCLGARNKDRMMEFLKITALFLVSSAVLFSGLLLAFGDVFIGFFIDSSETQLIETAQGFISILWPIFIFSGSNIIISAYLTSIHKPTASSIVAILRALILPLSFLYIILNYFPETHFFVAIIGAEVVTLIIAIFLCFKFRPSIVININIPQTEESI